MKIKAILMSISITTLSTYGQTTYQRNDGGVTVVEQGENFFGHRTTEVRRYDNQSEYINGEYAAEMAIAVIAIYAIVEAAPHIEKAWKDFSKNVEKNLNNFGKKKN